MSAGLPSQMFDLSEPISGYRVQERIGAGGYGEVWKAEAPGGIAKAIKIVYGYHEDERATRELNSLNRIKEVRHPFLLSLERIELVSGHLVIVTELATSSLKNLFEQYRQSGSVGIPRSELLGYLRDAADALDYILQEHSLQHLDVKPENLLLVGGRVKVADFGLVKDLQDVNCSVMGGLTPVYAAPELFDGRPNDHSDQYSLAIVYQELLTGSLPFEGRSTAQLAAQHLHSAPRLDRLPVSDQATIARALSKDPKQRFPSSREMIDRLLEASPNHQLRAATAAVGANVYLPPLPVPNKTEVLRVEGVQGWGQPPGDAVYAMTQPPEPTPTVFNLPPLQIKAEAFQCHPTIFIGVGGLAAHALAALQRRLVDRFGDIREVPALQVLLFDTDAETLKEVTEKDSETSLNNDAAILLPLRPSADYRRDSNAHLQWLSRRWIFNIPRSLQTQGFRPLGRLAFVDNCDRVKERIERAVRAVLEPKGLATSAQRTGLTFGGTPHVFIVSSTSGGTGGGMVLDVAYLVRKLLRDRGVSEEGVCGVLAHCAGRNPQSRDLAVANSYALLGELQHYTDPHISYPGEPACGLPAFAAQDAPFNNAYVVHMGEELEPEDFEVVGHKLAQYLYCNTVSPTGAFFDQCRLPEQPDNGSAAAGSTVRTFGLSELGLSYQDIPTAAIDELCKLLVARWHCTDRSDPDERPASLSDPNSLLVSQFAATLSEEEKRGEVASRAEEMGLKLQPLVTQLYDRAIHELGDGPEPYLLNVLEEVANNNGSGQTASGRMLAGALIVDVLDRLIRFHGEKDPHHICLESILDSYLEKMADEQGAVLQSWILSLVALPTHRVKGAQQAADYVRDYLRALAHEASNSAKAMRNTLSSLEETLRKGDVSCGNRPRFGIFGSLRKPIADRRLLQYFRLRIEELTLNGVCRLAGLVLAKVAVVDDSLRNLAADLYRLAEDFQQLRRPAAGGQNLSRIPETVRRAVIEAINEHKAELLTEMERELEEELRRIVTTEPNDVRRRLLHLVRRTARSGVLRILKKISLRGIANSCDGNPDEPIFSLSAGLKAATPRLLECGGARRLLLVMPQDVPAEQLVEELGDEISEEPTVVVGAENSVLLCYEAQQLPLRRVAAAVLDNRFQIVEVASRLHTRVDVPWTPL